MAKALKSQLYVVAFLSVVCAPSVATTLEELDAALRVLESKMSESETAFAPRAEEVEQVAPVMSVSKSLGCDLTLSQMKKDRRMLESTLRIKRDGINKVDKRVSEHRRSLLHEGCGYDDRTHLVKLRAELAKVSLTEARRQGDELLDCINQKIRASEREQADAIKDDDSRHKQIGISKRLNIENRFSQEMIDLSIQLGSAASLHDRLEQSVEEFKALCDAMLE